MALQSRIGGHTNLGMSVCAHEVGIISVGLRGMTSECSGKLKQQAHVEKSEERKCFSRANANSFSKKCFGAELREKPQLTRKQFSPELGCSYSSQQQTVLMVKIRRKFYSRGKGSQLGAMTCKDTPKKVWRYGDIENTNTNVFSSAGGDTVH